MVDHCTNTHWQHINILNLLLFLCHFSHDLHNALYIFRKFCFSENECMSIAPNHQTLQYLCKIFENITISVDVQSLSISIQPKTIEWSVEIWEWLISKYQHKNQSGSYGSLDVLYYETLSNIAQHLLRMLVYDTKNIHNFCKILLFADQMLTDFKPNPILFSILGEEIVGNETKLDNVFQSCISVFEHIHQTYDVNVDGTSGTKVKKRFITSVDDRARLLGSVLHYYDMRVCDQYFHTIGGSKKALFQLRHDLQRDLVLRIHKTFPLADILVMNIESRLK